SNRGVDLAPGTPGTLKSATSSDLLTWTVEPGVRIGPGSTLALGGFHPSAIVNANGTVTVYYGRNIAGEGAFYIWAATSSDGLTFSSETELESLGKGADPDVQRVGGSLRMYYGWGDDTIGTLYSAISASGAPTVRRR